MQDTLKKIEFLIFLVFLRIFSSDESRALEMGSLTWGSCSVAAVHVTRKLFSNYSIFFYVAWLWSLLIRSKIRYSLCFYKFEKKLRKCSWKCQIMSTQDQSFINFSKSFQQNGTFFHLPHSVKNSKLFAKNMVFLRFLVFGKV